MSITLKKGDFYRTKFSKLNHCMSYTYIIRRRLVLVGHVGYDDVNNEECLICVFHEFSMQGVQCLPEYLFMYQYIECPVHGIQKTRFILQIIGWF